MTKTPAARVLLADDEEEFRQAFGAELEAAGYLVKQARDGTEASGFLKEGWDLVLTDLRMPGMNGIELVRRTREACPEAEVIVMTGYGSIESAVEALKEGASDFIQKPFDLDEVLETAAKAVGRAKLQTSRSYLHGLQDSPVDAILGLDLEGRGTLWNDGAERLFGFKKEEVIGRDLLAELLPALAADQKAALAEARRTGIWGLGNGPWRTEARSKSGELMRIELTATPVYTGGRLKGVVATARSAQAGQGGAGQ